MGVARSTVARVGLAIAALAVPLGAHAQDRLEVELVAPEALRVGDRTAVVARVRGAGPHPLLLTPRSEGEAVEVVRGRLMRSDARDPDAAELELRIPVVARAAGAAVLRVAVAGYRCAPRCALVEATASVILRVDAAPGASRKKQENAAEPEPRSSSLSWVRLPGAEGCVGSTALAQAVEAQLGRRVFVSASSADVAVEGRVERTDGGWRATLDVTDAEGASLGERVLESAEPSCEALGETVTVTVAVMIDPLTAPPSTAPEDGGPPDEPEPRVIVRTERVEVPVEVPVPAEPEPAPRWRVEVNASPVGTVGLLPTLALGGLSAVILDPPDFVPVMIEGALVPWARAQRGDGAHADFLHVHAGLQICPLDLREGGLALFGCLGADAGAVIVVGGDLDIQEGERVIGQAHAALRGHWDVVGPLTLRVGLHLLVPFRHDPFVVAGDATPLYAPEPVAGMLDIGVGLHAP